MLRLVAAALLLVPSVAAAQTTAPTGTIRGAVVDHNGAAVTGARLTARHTGTEVTRTAETGVNGQFHLGNLPPGAYTLLVDAPGFAPLSVAPFLVSVGQVVEHRLTLQLAGVIEKLEVTEQPEAIEPTASTASAALGYDRIEEAPARSRNYLNFVLAAPSVAPSAGASSQRTMTGIRAPLGDSGFTFGGLRPRNNAILIDGMDNRDETTGGNRVAVGLEMVQEFRVASTAIGAELGGAAGGLLNMVTRSGVNLWHGDATFFLQHEDFNARKPEVASPRRPQFRRTQPGVSFLGPLRRDRTFIAAAVEHERERAEEWSATPAPALELINRVLSSPAFSSAAVSSLQRNLYETGTRGIESSVKLNHQLGANNTLTSRYAFSRGRVRHEVQGPQNFADSSAQGSSLTTDHSLVAEWLNVASPTLVNSLRLQLAQRAMTLTPNSFGAMLEVPGIVTFGEFQRLNARRTERHYQLVENLNLNAGSHRLSLGAGVHSVTLNATLRTRFAGIFLFPTLDDLLAARPDVFIQAFGDPNTRFRTTPLGFFLQDRWEPLPRLHLELGLRFDRQLMPASLPPSSNNFSPRFGLSWRPNPRLPFVLRAALGLFFDRYPLAWLNDALQKNGVRAFEQYATGFDAQRAFTLARGGTLAAPLPGIPHSAYAAAPRFPSTYSRKLTLGLEHGFNRNTSLSLELAAIQGLRLPRIRNIRGHLPPLYHLEQDARSQYWGASVSLHRRLTREFTYLFTYTAGRTRDDSSDFDEHPLDPLHTRADWSRSRQHQAHRLALSALFELPAGDLPLAPALLKDFFENLSFAPIFTTGSGRPINALLTTDTLRTGAYPLSARPPGFPRNPFFSPPTSSLDLRVMKTFHVLHDRALLQFGVESFNLTNHANTERVSPFFALPSSARLPSFAATLESLPARQVQFLVQFEY
jgi:hypothetical protein